MRILADKYFYELNQLITNEYQIKTNDPDDGLQENALEFDVFLIQTVTKLNEKTLLEADNLMFLGSATAGFDHVDIDHQESLGIEFASVTAIKIVE